MASNKKYTLLQLKTYCCLFYVNQLVRGSKNDCISASVVDERSHDVWHLNGEIPVLDGEILMKISLSTAHILTKGLLILLSA